MKKTRGFTLIEVMVVVAIIGILAAIAFSSYTAYVQRGWRANARVVLLENAQYMARFYSQNLSYLTSAAVAPAIPTTQAPAQGDAKYTITIAAQAASATEAAGFTLTATPSGWTDGTCGNLTLDQLGQRGASGATGAAAIANCWAR